MTSFLDFPERMKERWARWLGWMADPEVAVKVNGWLMVVWAVQFIPAALTGLKSSLVYLVFVSLYANFVGHWNDWRDAKVQLMTKVYKGYNDKGGK